MRSVWKALWAGAAGAGALAVAYARWIEPRRVSLERFVAPVERPGVPPGGLTILHLSDLHLRGRDAVQAAKLAKLMQLLAGERFDLLLLTGDLIHDDNGIPRVLALIETLQPRLAAFNCPGNRDYWQSSFRALFAPPEDHGVAVAERARRTLARISDFVVRTVRNERWSLHMGRNSTEALHAGLAVRGVRTLVNAAAHVQAPGVNLWVAGVDDLTQGQPDLTAALAAVPKGPTLILLTHNPNVWDDDRVERADLVLAGHTHGGQVKLPLIGALYSQGAGLSRRQPAGWFHRGKRRMFVSRGVGESFLLRFGAPPQAALIRLIPIGQPGEADPVALTAKGMRG